MSHLRLLTTIVDPEPTRTDHLRKRHHLTQLNLRQGVHRSNLYVLYVPTFTNFTTFTIFTPPTPSLNPPFPLLSLYSDLSFT